MRILALAMVLLLLFSTIGSAAEEENLKNIKADPSGILEPAEKRVISLSDSERMSGQSTLSVIVSGSGCLSGSIEQLAIADRAS